MSLKRRSYKNILVKNLVEVLIIIYLFFFTLKSVYFYIIIILSVWHTFNTLQFANQIPSIPIF